MDRSCCICYIVRKVATLWEKLLIQVWSRVKDNAEQTGRVKSKDIFAQKRKMILVTGENKEEIKQRNRKGIISNVMGKKM